MGFYKQCHVLWPSGHDAATPKLANSANYNTNGVINLVMPLFFFIQTFIQAIGLLISTIGLNFKYITSAPKVINKRERLDQKGCVRPRP